VPENLFSGPLTITELNKIYPNEKVDLFSIKIDIDSFIAPLE